MSHLDEAAFKKLVRGDFSATEEQAYGSHLATCGQCRRRLSALEAAAPDSPTTPSDLGGGPARERRSNDELPSRPLERGDKVGRYVLLDVLGEGGMGTVYAAYDSELDRKIAIKVLSASASQEVSMGDGRARLLREAQAMARISHPNVVAVHDVGTFGERVFVAMEYVDGGTLTAWMREKERSWREVVRAFGEAGRGLVAAHAAGLVHRDFKPENVLVGRDGRVRVTDFGLARLANLAAEDSTIVTTPVSPGGEQPGRLDVPLTELGLVMGTPQYMAPEHVMGHPPDARSDQFSFCAALYWALYRQRPFNPMQLAAAARQVLSEAHAQGTRPAGTQPLSAAGSSKATPNKATPYSSRAEGATASGPIREPPKDIKVPAFVRRAILRGLSVDPADRFESMAKLLEALGRDPSVTRRRALAAAAAVLVVAAGTGIVVRSSREHAQLCRGAERKLAGVWDGDVRAAVEKAFLSTKKEYAGELARRLGARLDSYARDWTAMRTEACEATRLRGEQTEQVLSLRMTCLDRRLNELQALTGVLSRADGRTVEKSLEAVDSLGSLQHCADVEALSAPVPVPEDPAVRIRVDRVASQLARVNALYLAGQYKEARELVGPAVEEARATHHAPLMAEALYLSGLLAERLGDPATAQRQEEDAVWLAEEGRYDEVKVRAATSLVQTVGAIQLHFDASETWGRLATAALKRVGGNDRFEMVLDWNLAKVRFAQGKLDEAQASFERALAAAEKAYGPDDFHAATILTGLAAVQFQRGASDKVIPLCERALSIYERTVGARHPEASYTHNLLGSAYRASKRLDAAQTHLQTALEILESSVGSEHADVANMMDTLTTLFQEQGRYAEALAEARRALAIKEKVLGPDNVDLSYSLENMGEALVSLSRPKEAIPPLERSIRLRETAHLQLADFAESRFALAQALWDSKTDRRRALALAREAKAGYQAGKDADNTAKVGDWLAAHPRP